MNILYLTSSMSYETFQSFCAKAKIKPNPSNQNFHEKIINALSLDKNNRINVISLRPFSRNMFEENVLNCHEEKFDNVTYYYPKEKDSKIYRQLSMSNEIVRKYKHLLYKDTIIIVDVLNLHLLKVAKKIAKKYKNIIIGICTDNLNNITGVNKNYIKKEMKLATTLTAYMSLTSALDKIYNIKNKPSYIFEGIVDDYKLEKSPQETPYFFFGGALYERYGLLDLIEAFKSLNSIDYDLIIAGHGNLENTLKQIAQDERHIKYLGIISKQDMYRYEQNSVASINPRQFSTELDNESIPSKVLEYLANKSIVISTPNTRLCEIFKDNIIWCETNKLALGLEKAISLKQSERDLIIKNSRKIIEKNYSIKVQEKKITYFIESLRTNSI